jgi:hypothetical protein
MTSITFYGHETMTYGDYIDLATGKTLVCVPGGGPYNVMPASGRPSAAASPTPNDGRFTTGKVVSVALDEEEDPETEDIPDEVPEDETSSGVIKPITSAVKE